MAATLISKATGNFTTAGTWALCSTAGESDFDTGNSAVPTSNADSSTFVLEANQIDAFAIKFATSSANVSGTFTATLRNSTTSTNVASITVNLTDFDFAAANANGWCVFPLGLNHTPNGTDAYFIRLIRTGGTSINFNTNGVGNNWSRQVRRTTTAAPGSGDKLIIAGELTGAGTGNNFTVTMNNTASTSFGTSALTQSVTVNKRGTLTFGTTALTAYLLKVAGVMRVFLGGTLTMTGAPSTTTQQILFDVAVNVDGGLEVFGAFTGTGTTKTRWTRMTSDKAAAATVIALTDTTGWQNSDVLCFAPTSRTAAEAENKTISTVDSSTQVTLTAGLTNAHSGDSSGGIDTRAEVGNLTSNVSIKGTSSSLQGYVVLGTVGTITLTDVEFANLGSGTGNKRGIDITTTTGSCTLTRCSFHDFIVASSTGINISGASASNITVQTCVGYNTIQTIFNIAAATTGTWTADGNLFCNTASVCAGLADVGGTFTNNVATGAAGSGINVNEAGATLGTFSGNVSHSNGSSGLNIQNGVGSGTITSHTSYRNISAGVNFASCRDLVFASLISYGNSTSGVTGQGNTTFTDPIFCGDTSFAQSNGFNFGVGSITVAPEFIIYNGSFGVATGRRVAHTGSDIGFTNSPYVSILLHNTTLASSTEVGGQNVLGLTSYVSSQKHDQTAGLHKTWKKNGTLTIDTTIFDVSPSLRLTPNSASNKLESGVWKATVDSGATVTFSALVRQSVVGDGTAYNGNLPRLVLKKNVAAGISTDTVLATATAASSGAWQTISGTTAAVTDDAVLSMVIDCDGTTGWINVDTLTVV